MPPEHIKLLKRAKEESPRGWRLRELIPYTGDLALKFVNSADISRFSHPDFFLRITIPRHPNRELDPNYVRDAVKLINKMLELKNEYN